MDIIDQIKDNTGAAWWDDIDKKLQEVEGQIDDNILMKLSDEIEFDSLSDTSLGISDQLSSSKVVSTPHKDYTEPTTLRVSTMTAVCKLFPKVSDLDHAKSDSTKQLVIDLELLAKNIEIDDVDGPVMGIQYGDLPIRGYNKRKKRKKPKKRNNFFNQATILVKLNSILPESIKENRIINVKIFLNGGIQMTGLKSEEEGILCVEQIIIPTLLETFQTNQDGSISKVIKSSTDIYHHNFRIVLINSDFKLGFKLKRDALYHILTSKYNIFATYEPCIYPGVNSKYYWNKNYKDELQNPYDSKYKCKWTDTPMQEGVCYCTKMCSGKGCGEGDGKCKKVTISIFQSGSVIITGARSLEQIHDAYKYINNVFMTEFANIRKKQLQLLHLLEKKEPKRKIIYIKKSKIKKRYRKKIVIKKSE